MSRTANFSSSEIYRLIGSGKRPMTKAELAARPKIGKGSSVKYVEDVNILGDAAKTYIKEKVRESKLKRSINTDAVTRPIIWGYLMEMYVFQNKLGMGYRDMNLAGRLTHHSISSWTGIPDFSKGTLGEDLTAVDHKAPTSLIKFCDLVDDTKDLETFKEKHKDFYWQLISNSELMLCDKAELIFYVPYASELPKILEFIQSLDEVSLPPKIGIWHAKWIADDIQEFMDTGRKASFPYLPDDSDYKDLNKFEFDVPQEDKELLTARVKMAVEERNKQLKA